MERFRKIQEGIKRLKPTRRERPWWEGRAVVIRPDVPGRHFDPGALQLFRTPEERERGYAAIDRAVTEVKARIDRSDRTVADWLLQDHVSKEEGQER